MNTKPSLGSASLALGTVGLLVLAVASGCGPAQSTPFEPGPDAAAPVDVDGGATPDTGADLPDGSTLEAGSCAPGTADCDGDPRNGCEAKVSSDAKNCGTCKHDCTGLPHVMGATSCSAGKCVVPTASCATGFAHCSSDPDDGCEADLSKPSTCGKCGTTCSGTTPVCASGTCSNGCGAGAPTLCSGSCVDTTKSATNCASCGNACPIPSHGQATCASSQCGFACNSGYHACGNACADNASPLTCGTSCTPCGTPSNGYATCDGTSCGFECNAGFHKCGNACAADADATQCGASCTVCTVPSGAGHATCGGGACGISCDTGNHLCNGTSCASNSSVATCGTSCTPCAAPAANGHSTCDGTSCGIACDASYHQCGGSCASNNLVTSCGTMCTPCATPPHAQPTCNGVSCGFTCDAGFADCDRVAANGCEVNITTASDCNACGHSCLGGACSAGACQPTVIATVGAAARALTVGAGVDFVAFGEEGAVLTTIHKDGSSLGTRQTTAPVTSIATDGTSLFYTLAGPAGEIWSAPVALNSPGTRIFSRGSSYLGNLSLMTGGILLWTDIGNRSVNQMMTNGQNVFTLYQAPANISPGQVVSADDYTYVAWLESNGRVMKSTDYMVTKSLVATLQSSDGLALDGTNLYVADGTAGTIWRFSRSTSQAYQFAIQQSGVRSIAVDATNVYWMSSSALMKAPIGGGSPVALPTGQPCFFSEVKLDDKAIYWLNACGFGNNYVMKLAK